MVSGCIAVSWLKRLWTKTGDVILSAFFARRFSLEPSHRREILRFAQNDIQREFFREPVRQSGRLLGWRDETFRNVLACRREE